MMTSRYPSEVGIGLIDETPGNAYPLADGAPTLSELLTSAGYRTVAQLTNAFLTERYSVCRGFAEVRHVGEPRPYLRRLPLAVTRALRDRHVGRDAEDLTRGAVAWLRDNQAEPFFMWVHYLDPHEPYGAPPSLGAGSPRHDDLMEVAKQDTPSRQRRDAREQLRALYEAEVTYCDRWIGKLLDVMDDMGLCDHTVIILTADHGEAFWEHGTRGHGRTFHDEVLRVPFVIAFPDGRWSGRVVETPVRLLDIMPTVLELASVSSPERMRGRSLINLLGDHPDSPSRKEEIFAECRMALPEQKVLRARAQLITYDPEDGTFISVAQPELFALHPGEEDPSASSHLPQGCRPRSLGLGGRSPSSVARNEKDSRRWATFGDRRRELRRPVSQNCCALTEAPRQHVPLLSPYRLRLVIRR